METSAEVNRLREELAVAKEQCARSDADREALVASLADLRSSMSTKLALVQSELESVKDMSITATALARHATRMEHLYAAKLETTLAALATLTAATRKHGAATEEVLAQCEDIITQISNDKSLDKSLDK